MGKLCVGTTLTSHFTSVEFNDLFNIINYLFDDVENK